MFARKNLLDKKHLISLISDMPEETALFSLARKARDSVYGNVVFIRGLIEISNYCKNDCYYCGIRKSNRNCARYRLTKDEILACCRAGYPLGFRTFVLQGGEDLSYTTRDICDIVSSIKQEFPDCAVTLSLGEKSEDEYRAYFDAGADRYLLRHETATESHYRKLHPNSLSLQNRKRCLYTLKEIGYQVGCGFMVGSPFQTAENLADDLLFIADLEPHMIGIGPFIPHKDTPFADFSAGSLESTLYMLALSRLICPTALLPATTALGTIDPSGREKGILAGANVVMPNLSPPDMRAKYTLYNNKLHTGAESCEHIDELRRRIESAGCRLAISRGDHKSTTASNQ